MIRNSIIALALFLILFFAFFRPDDPFRTMDMPPELIGKWTTDAPRYAKRSIKFDKLTLTFDLGEDGVTIQPIKKVKQRQEGEQEFFEILYGQYNDPKQTLRFEFDRADGGSIRFSKQTDVVWTLQSAP